MGSRSRSQVLSRTAITTSGYPSYSLRNSLAFHLLAAVVADSQTFTLISDLISGPIIPGAPAHPTNTLRPLTLRHCQVEKKSFRKLVLDNLAEPFTLFRMTVVGGSIDEELPEWRVFASVFVYVPDLVRGHYMSIIRFVDECVHNGVLKVGDTAYLAEYVKIHEYSPRSADICSVGLGVEPELKVLDYQGVF